VIIIKKKCSKCGIEKDESDFHKRSESNSPRYICKECYSKGRHDYYIKNKELVISRNKNWKDRQSPEYANIKHKERMKTHPHKTWCIRTINSHKCREIEVSFTSSELEASPLPTHCKMCGVKLTYNGNRQNWNSASLDRINNDTTLTLKNTQVICRKCNVMKQDLTMSAYIKYCKHIVDTFGDVV